MKTGVVHLKRKLIVYLLICNYLKSDSAFKQLTCQHRDYICINDENFLLSQYVECSYWSVSGVQKLHSARVATIRENWNLLYSAAFIICPVPDYPADDPLATVSVSSSEGQSGLRSSAIPVQNLQGRSKIGELSVCVKPLHYEFNRAVWLVEFIEMYKILGADHFIFYNHTVGPDVEAVLRYYAKEGILEVLPWALPVKTQAVSKKNI